MPRRPRDFRGLFCRLFSQTPTSLPAQDFQARKAMLQNAPAGTPSQCAAPGIGRVHGRQVGPGWYCLLQFDLTREATALPKGVKEVLPVPDAPVMSSVSPAAQLISGKSNEVRALYAKQSCRSVSYATGRVALAAKTPVEEMRRSQANSGKNGGYVRSFNHWFQ